MARSQVRGLSYTAAPAAAYVRFADDAGFRDGAFYGGALGFGFGEFLDLSGVYLRAPFRTDLTHLSAPDAATPSLQGRSGARYRLDRYGAALRVNAGHMDLRPYVTAGAGVLRFDPDAAAQASTETIYVQYGAGLTYALADRTALSVGISGLAYRYSPFSTFGFGSDLSLDPADFSLQTVSNTQLDASLRVYLGGRRPGQETEADAALRRGLGGVRVYAEPSYGLIDFNSRLGPSFPARQPFAGVSAGLDLGPYLGVRGFYLRATDEDRAFDAPTSGFRALALYGGELDFRFAQPLTHGITPYLIAGAGYLDAGDYAPAGTSGNLSDRPFAVAGAGLDVPLTRGLRLKAAARSLLMSAEEADDVSLPTRVYGSPVYSAGVEFSFATGRRSAPVPALLPVAARSSPAVDSLRVETERLRIESARLRAELDATRALYSALAVPDSLGQRDSLLAAIRRAQAPASSAAALTAVRGDTVRSNISGRVLQIPVPEVGEIYIRFGAPGSDVQVETAYAPPIVVTNAGATVPGISGATGLTAEQIQSLVRETIRAELAQRAPTGQALTQADVERAVREALRSQTAQNTALETVAQRLSALESRLAAPAVVRGDTVAPLMTPAPLRSSYRFSNVFPLVGVRWGTGPTQALVGARVEFRRPDGGPRFVPEVAVGLGGGLSFAAFGNYVLPLDLSFAGRFQPYAGAGVGLNTRSGLGGLGLALNLLAGTEYPIGPGRAYAEYSTLDFFQYHRVLAGYRISF